MKLSWRELLIAMLLAVGLWYGISGSEKVESQIKVRVEYKGAPTGLIIRDGLVSELRVRVRASAGLLRTMAERDHSFSMDLSSLVKGQNILPITEAQMPFWGGVEVMEIVPARIEVDTDTLEMKRVPVITDITGDSSGDFVVEIALDPKEVVLRGPARVLADMRLVKLPISVSGTGASEQTVKKALPLPDGVSSTPQEVNATISIRTKRRVVRITRDVQVEKPPEMNVWARPEKVTISVSVLESMAGKIAYSPDIVALAVLPDNDLGSYTVPVQVNAPDNVEVVKVEPERITLTLEQQETVIPKRKK